MINLVTVVGHNITMLPHMLNYYKDIVDKAPPKRSPEENENKVIEDTITTSRGRPKKDYTEEEIEALKQKARYCKKTLRK